MSRINPFRQHLIERLCQRCHTPFQSYSKHAIFCPSCRHRTSPYAQYFTEEKMLKAKARADASAIVWTAGEYSQEFLKKLFREGL